jgi:hypothetical protein
MVGRVTPDGVSATFHASGRLTPDGGGGTSVIQVDATLRGPLRR